MQVVARARTAAWPRLPQSLRAILAHEMTLIASGPRSIHRVRRRIPVGCPFMIMPVLLAVVGSSGALSRPQTSNDHGRRARAARGTTPREPPACASGGAHAQPAGRPPGNPPHAPRAARTRSPRDAPPGTPRMRLGPRARAARGTPPRKPPACASGGAHAQPAGRPPACASGRAHAQPAPPGNPPHAPRAARTRSPRPDPPGSPQTRGGSHRGSRSGKGMGML